MTRLIRYLAVAAAALGAIASNWAMAVGNITYLPAGQTTCATFSAVSVDPNSGDVTVTCRSSTPPPAGALGTISLSSTQYAGAKATSTTPASVGISVMRLNGNTGPLNGLLAVTSGTCTLAYNDVSFLPGDNVTKVVNLTSASAGTGICTITLTSSTTGALLGSTTTAAINVTDAAAPPPPIAGCPATPANVVIGSLLTAGLAGRVVDHARTDGLPPTIYSYPLPKVVTGAFFTTRDPDTPPSLTVDISISKCPGDYTLATDPTEVYTFPWALTTPFYPCVSFGSAESGVVRWGGTLDLNICKVDLNQTWYANVRITDDKGVYTCPVASATGLGCPIRFWWN
jgi:hypothetical protein